jgi:hypothetical protein
MPSLDIHHPLRYWTDFPVSLPEILSKESALDREDSLSERYAFQIGEDLGIHRLSQGGEWTSDSMERGYMNGLESQARFADVYLRKLLQLRRNAFSRLIPVSSEITVDYLRSITVTVCPISGVELTQGTQTESDWSVDRLANSLGYVPGNVCILNAGINRSKGKKPMTDVQFYEFKGLVSHYGITFDDLLDSLEHALHATCEHFNLYFYKNNQAKWSIHRNGKNYRSYTSTYKPRPIEIDIEAEPIHAAAGAAVVGGVLVVANFIGEHVCIFGENVAFFMDKTFNPQPEPGTKPVLAATTIVKPDPVKNTFIGLAVLAVAAAILNPGIGVNQRSKVQGRRRRH